MTVQAFAEVCGIVTTNSTELNIRSGASQTSKVILGKKGPGSI